MGTGLVLPAFPGLYTSAANTVYMPVNLIRPTDFSKALRNLLLRKANELYGSFCNLLPPFFAIPEPLSETWSVDAFQWTDPVGSTENMNRFLDFRNETLNQLLTEPVPAGGSR